MVDQDSKKLIRNNRDYGLAGRLNKDNSEKAMNKKDTHVARPNHTVLDPHGQPDLSAERKHWGTNLVDQNEMGMNQRKDYGPNQSKNKL